MGASKPEEYGYYFWWGDTVGYKHDANNEGWNSVNDGVGFSFRSGNCPTYGKSISEMQSDGYIDSTGNLVASHDAATAHLGAPWRMPTAAEFEALINNCIATWITTNGVMGCLVSGKGAFASRSIFLPAAGLGHDSNLYYFGSRGFYWSSTHDSNYLYDYNSRAVCFGSNDFYRSGGNRYEGQSVRPLQEAVVAYDGVTTFLKLDCRTGARTPSPEGEILRYDASWYENGEEVRITDNGTVVTTGTVGSYTWRPEQSCMPNHVLRLEVVFNGSVVGLEEFQFVDDASALEHTCVVSRPAVEPTSSKPGLTAEIVCSRCGEIIKAATEIPALGYIRNVTARQLWPHNKVALSFTVANDIGEVKGADEDLSVWCARGWDTNVAIRILGDRSAKPGAHQIVWDMEADRLILANVEAVFGVSVEEMIHLDGVQLWEDGPYWAECNLGASKPEQYGYYFSWGDTVGYKRNEADDGWMSVKDGSLFSFSSGNCPTYGKNDSQLQSEGYIDSSCNLVGVHDAATAHLGAPWRMPNVSELDALISNCDTSWITRGGVVGRLVRGRGAYASKSIFLPAAGYGYDSHLNFNGSIGHYWSTTLYSDDSYYGWNLDFDLSCIYRGYLNRYVGQSVRPLRGFAK